MIPAVTAASDTSAGPKVCDRTAYDATPTGAIHGALNTGGG